MTGRSAHVIEREARFASLAASGMTADEIAAAEVVHIQTVYNWARMSGATLKRKRCAVGQEEREARAAKMAEMYRQGVTLAKIGAQFGITRERVRVVIGKLGMTGANGGASVVTSVRRETREQQREAKALLEYGLPYAVVSQLKRDKVVGAYAHQKKSAAYRGIKFTLTFAQWFAIWQASGKLHLRGRGHGKYLMSRMSDTGGYELGNVHIQLATENSKEAVAKWKGKTKANRGVFCLYPGRELAWMAKVGKTSLGFFRTEAEAVAARADYFEKHPEVMARRYGRGYTYVAPKNGRAGYYQVVVGPKYVGTYATAEAAVAARDAYRASLAPAL